MLPIHATKSSKVATNFCQCESSGFKLIVVQPFYLQNIGDLPKQENLWQKEGILLGLEKILP